MWLQYLCPQTYIFQTSREVTNRFFIAIFTLQSLKLYKQICV